LIRGNHECEAMNELYGFHAEIKERVYLLDRENDDDFNPSTYKQRLVRCFNSIFSWLPLSCIVGDRILCVHGGIGRLKTLQEIAALRRPCDVVCDANQMMTAEESAVVDLLWSDPAESDQDLGYQKNARGVSCVFGSDIVHEFCKRNNIDLIVRAHQVVRDGYEYFARGHLITVFSATNYCNVMDNAGAILEIDKDLRVTPKLVEPRAHDASDWKDVGPPPSPMRRSADGQQSLVHQNKSPSASTRRSTLEMNMEVTLERDEENDIVMKEPDEGTLPLMESFFGDQQQGSGLFVSERRNTLEASNHVATSFNEHKRFLFR